MIRTRTAIDPDRIGRVVTALQAGDISPCCADDLQHCDDLLCAIGLLENNVPGLARMLFETISLDAYRHWMGQQVEKAADRDGYGDKWRAAIAAGRNPGQKDYLLRMCELMQKAHGVNQEDACRMMGEQSGRDWNDIRRSVIRAKGRHTGRAPKGSR